MMISFMVSLPIFPCVCQSVLALRKTLPWIVKDNGGQHQWGGNVLLIEGNRRDIRCLLENSCNKKISQRNHR